MTVCCIAISTWNRLNDLKKCIESINRQTYPYIEVVIVDNASTDGTTEYCKDLIDTFRFPVIYYRMPDSKSSAMVTLNKAFNMATGKYVVVMDDDAYILEDDGIQRLIDIMESSPSIFACSANVVDNYGNPNMVISDGKRILSHDEVNDTLGTIEWLEFHGACTIFKKVVGDSLGWYNESFVIYANEMDLSIRAWNLGYKILYTNTVTAIHNSNSTKPELRNRFHGYKNILYIINEYFHWYTRLSMYILSVGVHTIRMLNTMRKLHIDPIYLMKWVYITLKYGLLVVDPFYVRKFTNKSNHEIILNRLWTSYKMFILGKLTGKDLSQYGLTGR